MGGLLEGIRILAIEQYGAGPFGSMLLADLGAEVIKIEEPGVGDVGRYVPPYLGERDSIYFQSLNRNKKSVELDLATPEGRTTFEGLVARSDAVFNNLRGDQPAKRGLDYASLSPVNKAIVCVHLSGYGRHGPRASAPAYDYVIQGYAGWMSLTGEPDGLPQKSGLSLVDLSAGVFAALGLVSGVHHARQTRIGTDLEVPLLDTALSLLTYVGAWHLSRDYEPQRQADSSHPSQIPSQILPTSDGLMVVMCAKDKFFQRLVRLIGAPELATDKRYATFADRLENRATLIPALKELTRQRTTAHWVSVLGTQVPCAPVNTVREALADSRVQEAGLILSVAHEEFGEVRQITSPIHVPDSWSPPRRGPLLGEHTEQVLHELLDLDPSTMAKPHLRRGEPATHRGDVIDMQPSHARRSWMFVPGDSERFLQKIQSLDLDAALLDLEDGVAPARKPDARARVADLLDRPEGRFLRYVRVNDVTTDEFAADIGAVVRPGLDGLCVPKVESADMMAEIAEAIARAESQAGVDPGSVRVLAAIESAFGLVNASEIAAHERVAGLLLGAEDLTLDLDLPVHREKEAGELLYVRSALVVAARSAGKFAVDGVYPDLADIDALVDDIASSRRLGFTGKSLFHPSQLEHINRGFLPTDAEIAHARAIVDAFEEAEQGGSGAAAVNGALVDLPIVLRARRTLSARSTYAEASTGRDAS